MSSHLLKSANFKLVKGCDAEIVYCCSSLLLDPEVKSYGSVIIF